METNNTLGSEQPFAAELQDCAKLLIETLQNKDFEKASHLIQNLCAVRDRHIFVAVGKLTRALHDAIVNFNVDAEIHPGIEGQNPSEIRDASVRLNYVIELTQKAADRTMDRVESAAPIAQNLGQEAARLKTEWQKLRRRELSKDDFVRLYGRMDEFLDQMGEGTEQLSNNLQAIILEQGYQDLTGQVLKKVIGLVSDVENELVNLVRIAGQVEDVTGLVKYQRVEHPQKSNIAGEGPQIFADQRDDVVNGQDDVDDLLSSLGF